PKWCTDGRNTANNNISSGHRCTLLVLVSNSISLRLLYALPAHSKPRRGSSHRDTHMGEGLKFSFTLIVHHVASTWCAKTFFPSTHQVQEARLIPPHRTYSKAVTKYSSIQWPSIISTLF
ncbi:hypothetical protein IWW34DRAFT_625796, partial [Fusarium oxysporum f. sp. albedinis]